MNTAMGVLRSVLLGALGGLSAYALAGWLVLHAPASTPLALQAKLQLQPVHRGGTPSDRVSAAAARRFIAEAAASSLYDMQAARLVHARGADATVQDLAALLLRQHDAAWPGLHALAAERRVTLPQPSLRQRETLLLLHELAEPTRARLFVRHVAIEGARADIARCEAALQRLDGADAALRSWIERALPALRERAALAERLLPQLAERSPMA